MSGAPTQQALERAALLGQRIGQDERTVERAALLETLTKATHQPAQVGMAQQPAQALCIYRRLGYSHSAISRSVHLSHQSLATHLLSVCDALDESRSSNTWPLVTAPMLTTGYSNF